MSHKASAHKPVQEFATADAVTDGFASCVAASPSLGLPYLLQGYFARAFNSNTDLYPTVDEDYCHLLILACGKANPAGWN